LVGERRVLRDDKCRRNAWSNSTSLYRGQLRGHDL